MKISIYDDFSLIGMPLSALLLEDEKIGPPIYKWYWNRWPNQEWTNEIWRHPVSADRDYSIKCGHLDTLQIMDNETLDDDGNITFLDGYFEKWTDKYQHQLWSNWWGSISHKSPKFIHHDKLILCKTKKIDAAMHYSTASILKKITSIEDIDKSTEFWRMDHVETHKQNIGDWLDNWNTHWDARAKQAFLDGELRYFYQLNRLHWAVFKQPLDEVKMYTIEEAKQCVIDLFNNFDDQHMNHVIRANPDALVVDADWMYNLEPIQDYLGLTFTPEQLNNIQRHAQHYELRKEYFKAEFPRLFSKIWLYS